jgi:23S rRNA (cytidine1920-2'-O)/16S rRNA (cytidine1409-2'-O)-methyltransferase
MAILRADQALVARGLAPSRTAAQRLIADGAVRLAQGAVIRRPAHAVSEHDTLEVGDSDEIRFVSRAGAKLMHALEHFAIDPTGQTILDLGQSTGGFTDCLLQRGASQVIGVDVGRGQLHPRMRSDPRVICIEQTHVRDLDPAQLRLLIGQKQGNIDVAAPRTPGDRPDCGYRMAVVDLSFISLSQVLASIDRLLSPEATVLLLVKPQFELGPNALDGRGIVRGEAQARQALCQISQGVLALGWQILGHCDSAVRGTDGNLEFFLHARTGPLHPVQGHTP